MFLSDLIPDNIRKKLQKKTFSSGEIILFAELENPYVYFLLEGIAEAYIPTPDGFHAQIHIYEAGSFFGEVEQFYEGRHPVEVSALTPCVTERLHRDDFFIWLQQDFDATKFIIRELSYKLIQNGEYIEELSLLSVRDRLLRCIAAHHLRGDLTHLTKAQVIKEAKSTVRAINRAIAECSKQQLICYQNKSFSILNEEKVLNYLR